ncbi:MAG: ABC transporter substrate binding protein [Arcobacteraceae bacterium]
MIINSYHKGYAWSDDVIRGLEETLYKYKDIDTNILYMDSKRITSTKYYNNLKNLYEIQLQHQSYDLVIAIDRFAYDFVLENYKQFFTNEKILAVGLENYSANKTKHYNLEDKISVILEKRDLKANTQIIKTLNPGIKKLYLINDKSPNGLHTHPQIMELLKNNSSDYELIYLEEDYLVNLEKMFEVKQENTAILFIRFYKNKEGKLYKNFEIANFIKNAKVPVFVTDSLFIEKGATGGKVINLHSLGNSSGKLALELLQNPTPKIVVSNDFDLVFDAKKLEEFILPAVALNDEYKIVNKRETFFDRHRDIIEITFRILPFFLLLLIGLIHNIYKRKELELELRQRIDFDEVLLNAIESPIFWQDENGVIVDSNKRFCELIEMDPKTIYGEKLSTFSDNKNIRKIVKILEKYQENQKRNYEFKHYSQDKTKKLFLVRQEKFDDKKLKKQGFVTIFTDITEQRKKALQEQRDRQFIIQQSKLAEIGEVFSSIAHQWKTPLVEITAIAQELFYSKKTMNTEIKEDDSFVSDIMTQVNYMTDTINNFQKFIMPSNTKNNFFADDAIKEMLEIVTHNFKYNNINITIDIKESTSCEIYGYKNEFMQSFLNIINNAKEQLLQNDYKNRYIKITLYNEKNFLCIDIQDNAGGIKEKNQSKIFKPYYTTKKQGHGIGLYMTKMIIEDKMSGVILVKNNIDGAKFTIKLDQKI